MSELQGSWRAALAVAAGLVAAVAMLAHAYTAPAAPDLPPFPDTLSPEARALFAEEYTAARRDSIRFPSAATLAAIDKRRRAEIAGEIAPTDPTIAEFGVRLSRTSIGGVPALEIMPPKIADETRVIVFLHGGAYVSGTAAEALETTVPLAAALGLRTLSIDYTTAPAAGWRQITAEVVAVMRGLLAAGYRPADIVLVGESAGGGLAAGATLRMRDENVPMPAALVLLSPWTDLTNGGDSAITLAAADPLLSYDRLLGAAAAAYAAPGDLRNPWVSPVYGDFKPGFPPTLVQVGTRELLLSQSVRLVAALEDAGITARLDLHDGMPHLFQRHWALPEAKRAMVHTKRFLTQHLQRN